MGVIGKFVDPIIAAALQNKREEKLSPDVEEEDTLLQHLVRQTGGMLLSSDICACNDGATDHKFIKDETINIMIAGRDTVGTISSRATRQRLMVYGRPHRL
jgi:hypothetical protein